MTTGYEDQAICCEGYGPYGVLVLVLGRNLSGDQRAAVRATLARHGGHGGGLNSVAYLFHPVGVLRYPPSGRLAQRALDAGAEAVKSLPTGELEVLTDPSDLLSVQAALLAQGHVARTCGRTYRTQQQLVLNPLQSSRVQALVEELHAIRGVEGVFLNAELPA